MAASKPMNSSCVHAEWGALLEEVRPSFHLYCSYICLFLAGGGGLAWIKWGESPWWWLFFFTRFLWPMAFFCGGLTVWGAWGVWFLKNDRFRLYEKGVYRGPARERGGIYLEYTGIRQLILSAVQIAPSQRPIIGSYRILGDRAEIIFFPKLYAEAELLAQKLEDLAGLTWKDLESPYTEVNGPNAHSCSRHPGASGEP